MKIESIKNIVIHIEGKSFKFSYEELANIYIALDNETVIIKVKPNDERLEEN